MQIIAYNLCYSTCIGRPAHARAGAAAAALKAQSSSAANAAASQRAPNCGAAGGAVGPTDAAGGAAAAPDTVARGDGSHAEGAERDLAGSGLPQGLRFGCTSYLLPYGSLAPDGPLDPQDLVRFLGRCKIPISDGLRIQPFEVFGRREERNSGTVGPKFFQKHSTVCF